MSGNHAPTSRLPRVAVFAVACVAVSGLGHAYAGGGHVAPHLLGLGALLAALPAWLLSGRERGPEVILAATLATQFGLHHLFGQTAPGTPGVDGHAHPAVGMLLVHVTLALLTGWWLHRGEDAFWGYVRLRSARLLRLLISGTPALSAGPVGLRVAAEPEVAPASAEIVSAGRRRGPPIVSPAG
ncbi:hypothetical protein [Herbidospora daliensis]|uniref:hypothetical protein n=1 Tax=Herbidospora daliensis TaxID=295585 RepID=UPI0012FB1790|nr:hypothetical protein [Herbidospora daliensis]